MKKTKKNKQVSSDKKQRKLTIRTLETLENIVGGGCTNPPDGETCCSTANQL